MMEERPTRCIDPVMKYCQMCKYGLVIYPEGTTKEDVLYGGACFDTQCIYDLEDTVPTRKEIREFNKQWKAHDKRQKKLERAEKQKARRLEKSRKRRRTSD